MLSESCPVKVVVMLWLLGGAGGCAGLSAPFAPGARLPIPDFRVQRWLETLVPSKPLDVEISEARARDLMQERTAAMVAILEARENGRLSDKTWLVEVLRHVSEVESGTYAWGTMLHLMDLSIWDLGIEPLTVIHTIQPYLTSDNSRVASQASAMIDFAVSYRQDAPDDLVRQLKTAALETALRSYAPGSPPWKIVNKIYAADAEQAMDALAALYLEEPSRNDLAQQRRELMRLILGFDVIEGDEQKQMGDQIEAKLTELAKHPHWTVRAYVLAVLTSGRRGAPFRGAHWARDSAVPTQLLDDPHPFVRDQVASSTGYYYMPDPRMRAMFRGEVRN